MEPEDVVAGEEGAEIIDPRFARGGDAYVYFPHYASDEEEREYSLDSRPWREGDPSVKRIMLPGCPDAPPMRFTGHASNGRKREKKPSSKKKRKNPNGEERGTKTIRLRGLTLGQKIFYNRNSGTAIKVVVGFHAELMQINFPLEPIPRTRSKVRLYPIEVYGLTDDQFENLENFKPHVVRELVKYANLHGQEIIRLYDREDACNA